MRDGTTLAVTVYRPEGDQRLPTLLCRTPYGREDAALMMEPVAVATAAAGYVRVDQDVRGRWGSEGDYSPGVFDRDDAWDTIEWIVAQSWSDGRVAPIGDSAMGMAAWFAADCGHPAVTALGSSIIGGVFDGFLYNARGKVQLDVLCIWAATSILSDAIARSGAELDDPELALLADGGPAERFATAADQDRDRRLAELLEHVERQTAASERLLSRPLADVVDLLARYMPWIGEWAEHPDSDDPFWIARDIRHAAGRLAVPTIHLTNWNDLFVRGSLRQFEQAAQHGKAEQRLIVGPYTHHGAFAPVGEWVPPTVAVPDAPRFFGQSAAPYPEPLLEWLNEHLRGISPQHDRAAVTVYVQKANRWRTSTRWPLPETEWMSLYLRSDGDANSVRGRGRLELEPPSGAEPPDRFTYDPDRPVPSAGGTFLERLRPAGLVDQAEVEARDDVLVYTSRPLEAGLEVIGPVCVELVAITSAVDTDFTAKLTDVDPNGISTNVCEGITRLRYRPGAPGLVEPGVAQTVRIDLTPTGYLFAAGHSVRLQISSSSFPLTDPNRNNGGGIRDRREPVVAHQVVLHDEAHPSRIVLPVIR